MQNAARTAKQPGYTAVIIYVLRTKSRAYAIIVVVVVFERPPGLLHVPQRPVRKMNNSFTPVLQRA